MAVPPQVRTLVDLQAGVLTREQLRAAGITDAAIHQAVSKGRWQRVLPRVFVLHSGPVDATAREWAALLYAGQGAALSHATAAAAHGWSSTSGEKVHVSVPRSRMVAPQPGVSVHRARFRGGDICYRGERAVTAPARTVIDLVAGATSADDAIAVVARALQWRRVGSAQVLTAMGARRLRWRAQVCEALGDVAAGSQSPLEVRFARLLRAHGLPVGERQAAFGNTRADMAYDNVVIELDGRLGHSGPDERLRDMERDNAHSLAGRTVLRFGWGDVHGRSCLVAEQVGAAIGAQPRRCRKREGSCLLEQT